MQLDTTIWLASDGRWKGYVKTQDGKRKLIANKSREELINKINKCYEKRSNKYNGNWIRIREYDVEVANHEVLKSLKSNLAEYFGTELLSKTKLYGVYRGMCQRCYDVNALKYKYYGGRGIKVCDEWLNKFDGQWKFMWWAIHNGYVEGLSIDRIDVDGNYSPQNCRWATYYEQNNNMQRDKAKRMAVKSESLE